MMGYYADKVTDLLDENKNLFEENEQAKVTIFSLLDEIAELKCKRYSSKEVARILSDAVNGGFSKREFAEAIMQEHRTLQQLIMGAFMATIEEWAKQEHWDDRNEDTITISKEIVEKIENRYFRFI